MKKATFEKLYPVFMRTAVGKLRLPKRGSQTKWPVASINPAAGIVALNTPSGIEHLRYTHIDCPTELSVKLETYEPQEVADMLNRNVRL